MFYTLGTTQAQSPGPVSYLRAYENKGSEQKGTQTMQNQMNKYVSIYLKNVRFSQLHSLLN